MKSNGYTNYKSRQEYKGKSSLLRPSSAHNIVEYFFLRNVFPKKSCRFENLITGNGKAI